MTDNEAFFLFFGVVDFDFEHETVYLCFGERIGTLLFEGVLGGHHQEGFGEGVGCFPDGDLVFLHGFEQCRLHFGRRAVDFIGQHEIGEDGAEFDGEVFVFLAVDECSGEVGRQQVRRKLDTAEFGIDGIGQRIDGQRFCQPRDPFEEDMSVAEQTDKQRFDKVFLSDDDFAHFEGEQIDESALLFDACVELLNVYDFAHRFMLELVTSDCTMPPRKRNGRRPELFCRMNKVNGIFEACTGFCAINGGCVEKRAGRRGRKRGGLRNGFRSPPLSVVI